VASVALAIFAVEKSVDFSTASGQSEEVFLPATLADGFGGAYIGGLLVRGKKKGALIFELK